MTENMLASMSMDLAVDILKLTDKIQGHSSLKNQLERSGTSVGANIREANYAQSKADFISKLQIALKECYETEYWLELITRANILNESDTKNIMRRFGSVRRMLIASINTAKNNRSPHSP